MGSRGRVGATMAALCAAVAISGCGDVDDPPDPPDLAVLLEHVPPGATQLRFADLDAAREQLGLSEDADVADLPRGEDPADDGQRRLAMTAGLLINHLQFGVGSGLREAIDHREITAAASNVTTGALGISVIRTSQPFDEIASALEGRGYTRDGNVVRTHKFRDAPTSSRGSVQVYGSGERIEPAALNPRFVRQFIYPVVADAGDGVIVFGYRRPRVEEALTGSSESDDPVRAALDGVEGVARDAIAVGPDCVQALAVGESFDPETAEVRIAIDGEASADRFRLPELSKPRLEYGEPEVENGVLTAEITGGREPDVAGVQLALDLNVSALDPDRIYEC